jgi:branched-chain amino acid aminotransferase
MTTREPLALLHGRLLSQREVCLPLHDAGLVWGATVTDLCRTFYGRLFRLSDHLIRFRESCRLARVPLHADDEELTRVAEQIVSQNSGLIPSTADLALVMFATPGPIGYYLGEPGGPGDGPPTLGMHTFPLPFARLARLFREGARLVVPSVRHLPATCVDPRIKQRSRLFWWLAEQEVHAVDPFASALLRDERDHLTETAAANFLIVKDGDVVSPPRTSILNGISLQVVEELCQELGIPFVERPLTLADALTADEAMLAGTTFCLAGVSSLQGRAIPWPGPTWRRLLDAWSARVGLDIRGQVEAHAA